MNDKFINHERFLGDSMNMELIFSTKERIKILKEVIFKTDSISVNKIAAKLKLSKGLISKYFDILTKGHILRKSKAGIFVSDRPITKSIKILLNITDININFFKKYPFVKSVGLYGSCAKGENTQESDIDVWIRVGNAKEEELASLTSQLKKKMNRIKITLLTDKKIDRMKKEDELFYHALAFGSITLYGDKDGVQL